MATTRFIFLVLVGFALSCALHAVATPFVHSTLEPVYPNQQNNLAAIENYLYRPGPPDVLMLGSSATAPLRLPFDNAVTVGVQGRGAMTGLEVLQAIGRWPRVLIVEVNGLHREPEMPLLERTVYSPLHQLRYHLPFLRISNNPNRLFARVLLSIERLIKDTIKGPAETPTGIAAVAPTSPAQGQPAAVAALTTDDTVHDQNFIPPRYALPPLDPQILTSNLRTLKKFVDEVLRPAGTEVYFVQAPTPVGQSKTADSIRSLAVFRELFGTAEYPLIIDECPDCYTYGVDRMHLDSAGNKKFIAFLARELTKRSSYLTAHLRKDE